MTSVCHLGRDRHLPPRTMPRGGTAAQTLVTDSDGKATVYVKRGSYADGNARALHLGHHADHERLLRPHGQDDRRDPRRRSSSSSPTNTALRFPARRYPSAAKTITTGADGTASFSVKRGSYVAQVACTGYKTQAVQLSVTGSLRERVKLG